MFEKLKDLLAVFRQGVMVANPKAWKTGQITGTVLGVFLLTIINLAKVFGYDLPVDADTANAIGGGIVAAANVLLTITTSKHMGIPGLAPAGVDGRLQPTDEPVPAVLQSPAGGSAPTPAARNASMPRLDDATRQRAEDFLRARKAGNPSDPGFEAP